MQTFPASALIPFVITDRVCMKLPSETHPIWLLQPLMCFKVLFISSSDKLWAMMYSSQQLSWYLRGNSDCLIFFYIAGVWAGLRIIERKFESGMSCSTTGQKSCGNPDYSQGDPLWKAHFCKEFNRESFTSSSCGVRKENTSLCFHGLKCRQCCMRTARPEATSVLFHSCNVEVLWCRMM